MKKFTCAYLDDEGYRDQEVPQRGFSAESAEEAARLYSEQEASSCARIEVTWGLVGGKVVPNPAVRDLQAEQAALVASRLNTLRALAARVKDAEGALEELPFTDLMALIENMKDFPAVRDELDSEERDIREHLYKMAFFDRNLQVGLQTMILNQIASGQPTTGAADPGKSNLARNAAMLGGAALALQKLNQIEENTGDVSDGLGFD